MPLSLHPLILDLRGSTTNPPAVVEPHGILGDVLQAIKPDGDVGSRDSVQTWCDCCSIRVPELVSTATKAVSRLLSL